MLAGDTDDAQATQKRKLNQSLLHRITGRAHFMRRQARLHNGLEPLKCLVNAVTGCAVKGGGPQRELNPPGNWFAPPGSNQSSSGGNETAEASGAEGR
jgi:hypothetical protein